MSGPAYGDLFAIYPHGGKLLGDSRFRCKRCGERAVYYERGTAHCNGSETLYWCGACAAEEGAEGSTLAQRVMGAAAERAERGMSVPGIPMLLWCPECGARHVDRGEFAIKPHHTHACQTCGHVWRPAVVPTTGVKFLPGFRDADD